MYNEGRTMSDNKIKGKTKIQWGVVLFVGGQKKWQHTGKDAAFLMKFILKQYEQKSATLVFILILPLFVIKKFSFSFLSKLKSANCF